MPPYHLSVSSDLTVLCVLVLCVCLYVPGLVLCRRADVVSKENQRVHYLTDNSPCDPYCYAVTIHTGLCSAASMSAKVRLPFIPSDQQWWSHWFKLIKTDMWFLNN